MPLCTIDKWRERRHAWPKLWKHHAAQPVADRLNEVALERGEPFLERYGGRISSEWYFPKLIEVWLEDREIYDECDRLHRGDRLDRLVADRGRVPADRDRRLQGDVVARGGAAADRVLRGRLSRLRHARREARRHVRAARARRRARSGPRSRRRLGLPESVAVAVGNVDAWVSVPGSASTSPGTFVIVIGTSICDMIVHPDETRLPGITGVVKDGILPGLYGYEAGQAAVGDMLAWFVDDVGQDSDSYAELEKAAASSPRARPGWSRSTGGTATARSSPTPTSPVRSSVSGCTPRASRSTARCSSRSRSAAAGSWTTSRSTGSCCREIVACGGIAERSPLMMQLLADTSGREVHVPEVNEIPARGAALFGAVAAGVYEDIASAVAATRPQERAHVHAGPRRRRRPTTASTRSTAGCTSISAVSEVRLLHDLKRIRTERRERVSPQPRIGLLGIMQELYDDMIPGITERQAEYATAVAKKLAPVADVRSRGRRAIARTSRRSARACGRRVDGIAIVMLTYGPAMRTVRALMQTPVPLLLANIQPDARSPPSGHGRPDVQPGDPWRPGPGQRARPRRLPFSVITGDWQSAEFARAFEDWARAAQAVTALRRTRIGLLGYPMNGMGDILYDPPSLLRRIGPTIVSEDLGPLVNRIEAVADAEVERCWRGTPRCSKSRATCRASVTRTPHGSRWRSGGCSRTRLCGFSFHFDSIGGDGRVTSCRCSPLGPDGRRLRVRRRGRHQHHDIDVRRKR